MFARKRRVGFVAIAHQHRARAHPCIEPPGFADLGAAREWAREFVHWYNRDHRHSGIRYVSPAQRHAGQAITIRAARHELHLLARARHPARWSRHTRNWAHIACVTLNPERDQLAPVAPRREVIQPLAA